MSYLHPDEPGPEMHLDRAEWVIVGYHPSEGGLAVLASRTLSSAVLKAKRDRWHDLMSAHWMDSTQERMYVTTRPVVVVVECRDFVMIKAESWRQVMEALYRRWAPPDGSAFM